MKYLFFDTETTGVPKNYNGHPADFNNWPRVIQLAFALYDDEQLIQSYEFLIKPNGWLIPTEKFWIDNGFSTEKSLELGIGIEEALSQFLNCINQCDVLIANNLKFDLPIVQSEMLRLEFSSDKKPLKFCTMMNTTNVCKLPGARGGFKWPKLEELHHFLFSCGFDGAHDALNDVMATAKCFFELKNRELITV